MDGFTEGNILIEKYFPSVDPEELDMDSWIRYMAKVRVLQDEAVQLTASAIAKVFSEE